MLWIPLQSDQNRQKISYQSTNWHTPCSTSEKISTYSGAFRAFQSISANSLIRLVRILRFFSLLIEKSLPLDLLYRRWKKIRTRWRHEAKPVWERKYKRRRKKRWEKRLKRAPVSHWRLKICWNFGNEKKKKLWLGEMRSKYCRPRE